MLETNKITEIAESTTNVIDWIVNRLKTYSGWNVRKYSGTSYSKIFNHIPELSLPAAVVSYHGSSADDNIPRRTLNFSIVIITEDVGDFETAVAKSLILIDKAMELLDYEKYNGILFKFKSDSPLDLSNSCLAAYTLSFEALDY